jgi:hypothetical protein
LRKRPPIYEQSKYIFSMSVSCYSSHNVLMLLLLTTDEPHAQRHTWTDQITDHYELGGI